MKKILGTSVLCFVVFIATAQKLFSLSGKVVDAKTNELLAHVNVSCNQQKSITNNLGVFSLDNFQNGKHKVSFSLLGYEKQTIYVEINDANKNIEIKLQQNKTLLENLEVTSIRASDKSPFAKTNLSKEEIALVNQGQDLPFALNQTANVVVSTDAGNGVGYTGIRIRGTDATRINITLNGIPFNDAESQGSFFVNMPDMLSSANSIQVQRGVGTSSNGTSAFGATINLATNEINKNASAEINSSYGSFNTFKNTVKASSGLINNRFTLDARLSQITSDGYIDRASSNLKAFALSGTYLGDKSSLKMNIFSGKEITYQAWNGIDEATLKTNRTFNSSGTNKPGEPYKNEVDNYTQTHYQLFYNKTINSYWSYNVAAFYTRGFGYYENYRKNKVYADYGAKNSTDTANLITQLWLDNHFYGSIFSAQYKKKNNVLTIGGSYTNYNGKHYSFVTWAEKGGFEADNKFYNLNANKWERSFYTKMQHDISKYFSVYADVQYRFVEHDMPGFRNNKTLFINRKFNFINPKFGITYQGKNTQAFFSYANATKEPNRDDFEANAMTQPKAEQLHDFELGFSKKGKNFNVGANLYYMLYKDQLIVTGRLNDVGAYNRVNVDDSYRMGIEINGDWKINKWLQVSGNIAFSQNKIKRYKQYFDEYDANWNWIGQKDSMYNNTNIALSPSIVSSSCINIMPHKNLQFHLIGKYVGKQYLDNSQTESRSISAFYTQDFKTIYTLNNKLFKQTTFILTINNIFNNLYSPTGNSYPSISGNVISDNNYYFPAAGTNFMFSVNVGL